MAGRPRLLSVRRATPAARFALEDSPLGGKSYALLLATFSTLPHLVESLPPISRHFDPFGTEFSVKPGQANHSLSIYKDPSSLRRNSKRPRDNLDFTVPMLICRVAAISS